MATNGTQPTPQPPPQPPVAGIAGLFLTKAQQANAILGTIGKSLGNPSPLGVNPKNGRREQVFADGEIAEKVDNAQSLADLTILYRPFSTFINNNGHHWLGPIIEDFYSAKNGGGKSIVVQRYQNGVIWWDGQQDNPYVLGWDDWKAIAGLGNKQNPAPPPKGSTSFGRWFDRIALEVGRVVIIVICFCVVVYLLSKIL